MVGDGAAGGEDETGGEGTTLEDATAAEGAPGGGNAAPAAVSGRVDPTGGTGTAAGLLGTCRGLLIDSTEIGSTGVAVAPGDGNGIRRGGVGTGATSSAVGAPIVPTAGASAVKSGNRGVVDDSGCGFSTGTAIA